MSIFPEEFSNKKPHLQDISYHFRIILRKKKKIIYGLDFLWDIY